MGNNIQLINYFIIYIFLIIVPFSYSELFDIRVILILPLLIIFLLLNSYVHYIKLYKTSDLLIAIYLFFILIIYSIINLDFIFIVPIILFLFNSYYFSILGKNFILKLNLKKIVKLYVYIATVFGLVLLLQAFLYFNGIYFGKIEVFGGHRFAFYVNWKDSSFVSLYLASAIPLTFYSFGVKSKTKYIIILILFISSYVSSARTGLFSLILLFTLVVFVNTLIDFLKHKIKKTNLLYIFTGICIFVLLIILIVNGFGRFSEGDNGRIETYIESFSIFFNSPLIGTGFSSSNQVSVHNFLIHTLASGGLLFFIPWLLWLFFIIKKSLNVNHYLRYTFFVILIGCNFIPSFFSAYFLGIIISFILIDYVQSNIKGFKK